MADRKSTDMVVDIVKITAISDKSAKGLTRYNSEIELMWQNSLPSPAPKVGEIWLIERIAPSVWTFKEKMNGDAYNAMRYSMRLDARSCIGRERAIAEDIALIGIDEVFLKVAADGLVMWDSEAAKKHGLISYGDHITQLVDRLVAYGKSVVFVIDCELWTTDAGSKYRQAHYVNGEVTYSDTFCMSYFIAREPVKEMVDELYERWGDKVNGVCFEHFGLEDEKSDFNIENVLNCCNEKHFMPDESYVSPQGVGEDDVEYWDKRYKWLDYNSEMQLDFLSAVASDIGNWPVSVIIYDKLVNIVDSDNKTGRLSSGISDGFGHYGWSMVGVPLSYSMQSDKSAALRSFEYMVAYEQRLAEGSTPLYVLDLANISEYDGVFEILAKYNATNVLLDGYEDWRLLSDANVIRLSSAMDTYRVTPKQTTDYVGLLVSSYSRDTVSSDMAGNKRWCKGLENLASLLLDKLPHRLKVFFDGDLCSEARIKDVAALIVYEASNIDDDGIATIDDLIRAQDRNVVLAGIAGNRGLKCEPRGELPFIYSFGQDPNGDSDYSDYVKFTDRKMDIVDASYILDDYVHGIIVGFDKADAVSVSQGDDVIAPIMLKNRSSYVAMDVMSNDLLLDVCGDLALYALGRD